MKRKFKISGKSTNKIIAWYSPETPINFGLKNYSGLPGLILELKKGNLFYKAVKIDLTGKNNIKIKKPVKGKKVSLEDYKEISKKISNSRR